MAEIVRIADDIVADDPSLQQVVDIEINKALVNDHFDEEETATALSHVAFDDPYSSPNAEALVAQVAANNELDRLFDAQRPYDPDITFQNDDDYGYDAFNTLA